MVLKKEITHQIKEILKENPQGLSITDIVKAVNINRNTTGRYLENLLVSGQVEMRRFGMAKIYQLSQRVPLSAVLSLSSELVLQLDSGLRIVFANEPFLSLVGTDSKNLLGKNIEYTPVALVFDESFPSFIEDLRNGITGKEWAGEIELTIKDIILFCQIAPTVFEDGRKGVSVILEDITKRKQAEQKIEESELQFRLLAENTLDMIGRIKPDYTHIYASPAYTTTLGYLPEEIIGKPGQLFIHPDDVHIMKAAGSYLTEQNSSATVRFRARQKDGHYIWIESHVRAIFDEKTHELSEYYTVTRDITERKLADDALRESEDRYRKLVEISPDAVFLHREGKIIYANPATFTLLGASRSDEIIGKSVLDFVSPEYRHTVRINIQKDLEGMISPRAELSMIRIDGSPIIVEGRGVATEIDGKTAVQVALRDITEHKKAEEALRVKERQLFSIYSNVPDVLFYLSVEPDNNFRFLTVNQSFLDSLHLPEDQVVGKYVHKVIPEPLLSRALDKYKRAIREKKTIQWEEVQDYPTGKRYGDCHVTAIFDERGHPTNIIGSVHDSTRYKTLEEELRESKGKLTALLGSVTDIMSMMDKDLTIIWANDPAKRYFGNDIIGRKCFEVYHKRQVPCEPYPCPVRKAFLDGKIHHHEVTLIDDHGGKRVFEGTANVALRDNSGNPVAVLETAREITEKKKAETALRESEAISRALINAPTDSVILMDSNGIILALNETAALRFGKPINELVGVLADNLLPEELARSRRSLISRVSETKEMVRFEDERDGRWFDTVAYPVFSEIGDVSKIAIVARDITYRRNIEEAFFHSEQ